jgi:hypothetical protein
VDRNGQRLCHPCAVHLANLAALAHGGTPLTDAATLAVRNATAAVLGEAVKAVAADQDDMLLATRLSRLAAAARETMAAAGSGDTARLQREARRFEAFTSALWSVLSALPVSVTSPPAPRIAKGVCVIT